MAILNSTTVNGSTTINGSLNINNKLTIANTGNITSDAATELRMASATATFGTLQASTIAASTSGANITINSYLTGNATIASTTVTIYDTRALVSLNYLQSYAPKIIITSTPDMNFDGIQFVF